jgi:hypothetical protein
MPALRRQEGAPAGNGVFGGDIEEELGPAGEPGSDFHRYEELCVHAHSHEDESDHRSQESGESRIAVLCVRRYTTYAAASAKKSGEGHQGKGAIVAYAYRIARTEHHRSRRG